MYSAEDYEVEKRIKVKGRDYSNIAVCRSYCTFLCITGMYVTYIVRIKNLIS